MAGIAEILQLAAQCQQSGRLDEARRFCKSVLEMNPDHHGALYILSTIIRF